MEQCIHLPDCWLIKVSLNLLTWFESRLFRWVASFSEWIQTCCGWRIKRYFVHLMGGHTSELGTEETTTYVFCFLLHLPSPCPVLLPPPPLPLLLHAPPPPPDYVCCCDGLLRSRSGHTCANQKPRNQTAFPKKYFKDRSVNINALLCDHHRVQVAQKKEKNKHKELNVCPKIQTCFTV